METADTSAPPASVPLPPPVPPRRRWPRRLLRIFGLACAALVLLGMAGWATLAIALSNLHGGSPRWPLAGAFAVASLAAIVLLRRRRLGVAAFLLLFGIVLTWWFALRPARELDWATDVAVMPQATFDGDLVTLHNVRNFDYRSETDFDVRYYDKIYDLTKLRSVDYILSYWGSPAIAHAFVSFGFEGDDYVAFSIETRKEKSESYSAVEGFFRQYELIYVAGDERDLVRLRTNYRKEDVYIYRTRSSPRTARAVFLEYVNAMNELVDHPRFYNALTSNCTTGILVHIRPYPPYPRFSRGVLLPGHSARFAHDNGGLDQSMPFEALQERAHINAAAQAADQAADFSRRIRVNVPTPPPRADDEGR